jgi:hypothetical protein
MKIETTNEYCSYFRRATDYIIEFKVPKGEEVELSFCKWVVESDIETDNGTDFDEESQKIYDSLPEEVQTEIDDYILELK